MEERLAHTSVKNAMLWLEKLEKNENGVGISTLKKRYRKGYEQLLQRTRDAVDKAVEEYLLTAVHGVDELKKAAEPLLQTLDKDQVWNAAYETKTLEAAFETAFPLFLKIQEAVYQPYWLQHVKWVDGRYYNDLIDAFWNSNGYWEGDRFTTICLPPTHALCEKIS